jgi:putative acetyltransferase
MSMVLRLDDLRGPEIARLLEEHMADMRAASPPESVHALDLDGLRKPEISFWTLWQGNQLAGCGALKELDATHAEIKSMRTAAAFRRRGVARQVLQHLLDQARQRQYQRVSLETGPMAFFAPARALYASFGFEPCGPFADYWNDPNSVFMTMAL